MQADSTSGAAIQSVAGSGTSENEDSMFARLDVEARSFG